MGVIRLSITEEEPVRLFACDYVGGAFAPQVDVTEIEGGHRVTITSRGPDGSETHIFDIMDGQIGPMGPQGIEGKAGVDGISPTATVAKDGNTATITITDAKGTTTAQLTDGVDGKDGISPTAKVERNATGALVTITDKNGTTTAQVMDGRTGDTGATGPQGPAGVDGVSPTASVTQTASGATITVTDKSGTTTANIANGATGPTGPEGSAGRDGVSPTIATTEISGGHRVTVTDASGTRAFDVLDGRKGDTGATGPQGETGPTGPRGPAGVSPTASVERVEGGALVTVTDASGTTTAMLNDAEISEGSVTDEMLAPDGIKAQVGQLWGNQLTRELTGEILTAADAYAAPPMALTVDGKSTQDGTPTPDAPVSIESVVNPVLHVSGSNLLDMASFSDIANWNIVRTYAGFTVEVPNTSVTIHYDGAIFTGDGSYLNVHAGGTAFATGNFLVHNSTSIVATSRTITPTDGRITFGLYPKTATSLERVVNAIGSTLRVNVDADAAYEPYVGTTAPLYDGTLRSLPDGTKDTLALTYLRPSTREGWAWYSGEVTRRVATEAINGSETDWWKSTSYAGGYYRRAWASRRGIPRTTNHLQDRFATATSTSDYAVGTCLIDESLNFRVDNDLYPTLADFKAWLVDNPIAIQYPLATPTTTTLDPIELPVLPASNVTVWVDGGSATPALEVTYERNLSIVIANIESQLAELATS